MRRRILILCLSVILVIAVILVAVVYTTDRKEKKHGTLMAEWERPQAGFREVGELKSLRASSAHSAYAVHYPFFNNSAVDAQIDAVTAGLIAHFNEEYAAYHEETQATMAVNYESYLYCGRVISVYFRVDVRDASANRSAIRTYVFDLDSGKEIFAEDGVLLKGEYLSAFSQAVKQYLAADAKYEEALKDEAFIGRTEAKDENFRLFYIDESGLVLLFEKGTAAPARFGVIAVSIPLEQIRDFLMIYPADATDGPDRNTPGPENTVTPRPTPEVTPTPTPTAAPPTMNPDVDPSRPVIAFTFDDGPDPDKSSSKAPYKSCTDELLNILKENGARASFFVLGECVSWSPEKIRRAAEEGNEICNHTYHHKNLKKLTEEEIRKEIEDTNALIEKYTGKKAPYVRLPGGGYNDTVLAAVDYPIVHWSVDTKDWDWKDKDKIIAEVKGKVKDGDIVLFHDIYPSTVEACRELIPALIAEGFQLVTVSELMAAREVDIEPGRIYYSAYQSK